MQRDVLTLNVAFKAENEQLAMFKCKMYLCTFFFLFFFTTSFGLKGAKVLRYLNMDCENVTSGYFLYFFFFELASSQGSANSDNPSISSA